MPSGVSQGSPVAMVAPVAPGSAKATDAKSGIRLSGIRVMDRSVVSAPHEYKLRGAIPLSVVGRVSGLRRTAEIPARGPAHGSPRKSLSRDGSFLPVPAPALAYRR